MVEVMRKRANTWHTDSCDMGPMTLGMRAIQVAENRTQTRGLCVLSCDSTSSTSFTNLVGGWRWMEDSLIVLFFTPFSRSKDTSPPCQLRWLGAHSALVMMPLLGPMVVTPRTVTRGWGRSKPSLGKFPSTGFTLRITHGRWRSRLA